MVLGVWSDPLIAETDDTVVVEGGRNEGAAWYHPDPNAAAEEIRGGVAFWRCVLVVAD
jgi:uncharacterized protein (DUF427 family)